MKQIMVGLKIFQLTSNGLVEVIEFETERLPDKKRQQEAIETLTEMLYNNDSMFLTFEDQSVVLHNMKKNTFRTQAVFEIQHGKGDDDDS
jgi:hypothetical protein